MSRDAAYHGLTLTVYRSCFVLQEQRPATVYSCRRE